LEARYWGLADTAVWLVLMGLTLMHARSVSWGDCVGSVFGEEGYHLGEQFLGLGRKTGWEVLHGQLLLGPLHDCRLGTRVTGIPILCVYGFMLCAHLNFLSIFGWIRVGENDGCCLLGQFVRLAADGWPIFECS